MPVTRFLPRKAKPLAGEMCRLAGLPAWRTEGELKQASERFSEARAVHNKRILRMEF